MTPLATRIARELAKPVYSRRIEGCGANSLVQHFNGIHCFEVSEVIKTARDLHFKQLEDPLPKERLFYPAPKTWIEWRDTWTINAFLLFQPEPPRAPVILHASSDLGCKDFYVVKTSTNALGHWPHRTHTYESADAELRWNARWQWMIEISSREPIAALLALINTPQIVGRRQHMPSRAQEYEVMKRRGSGVQFPLRAWTEIRLEITPPRDAMLDEPHEAHLTGAKARHFVRQHLRIQHGKLVTVKAHWRGDAALGIKQSRYTVTASGGL